MHVCISLEGLFWCGNDGYFQASKTGICRLSLHFKMRLRGQGLFRKSSKWCPWVPSPDALQILDRREAEGRIQGAFHFSNLPLYCHMSHPPSTLHMQTVTNNSDSTELAVKP